MNRGWAGILILALIFVAVDVVLTFIAFGEHTNMLLVERV